MAKKMTVYIRGEGTRTPTRREKIITANSLRSTLGDLRVKSGIMRTVSYGYYGTKRTTQRISKGMAGAIYFNRLRQVMKKSKK